MRIYARYSHKNGEAYIRKEFPSELSEVETVIARVDASTTLSKISEEKTMKGLTLYAPITLNNLFRKEFGSLGWRKRRLDVFTSLTTADGKSINHSGYREMDFVKNRLGVEVQFGKYAFMVYNVSAKMTIFHNKKIIDAGIEIVGMRSMTEKMSTGVSYFEQVKTDLEMRGVADIDIPVLIIGVTDA